MIEKKNTKPCCSLCVSATRKGYSSVISFKTKHAVFSNTLSDQTTKALSISLLLTKYFYYFPQEIARPDANNHSERMGVHHVFRHHENKINHLRNKILYGLFFKLCFAIRKWWIEACTKARRKKLFLPRPFSTAIIRKKSSVFGRAAKRFKSTSHGL